MCFSFWYHMYGVARTMALRFYVILDDAPAFLVWSETGNKGNRWKTAEFSVVHKGRVKVRPRVTTLHPNIWLISWHLSLLETYRRSSSFPRYCWKECEERTSAATWPWMTSLYRRVIARVRFHSLFLSRRWDLALKEDNIIETFLGTFHDSGFPQCE